MKSIQSFFESSYWPRGRNDRLQHYRFKEKKSGPILGIRQVSLVFLFNKPVRIIKRGENVKKLGSPVSFIQSSALQMIIFLLSLFLTVNI